MPEIYVSTDIETDGPIPGPHSMLSFASAAYRPDKTLAGTFEANLETLPDAAGDPKTMAWWLTQPEAWAAARTNPRDPALVMADYARWVKSLPGTPVFVAYPAGFDFLFVYWYLIRFTGASPFSFSALDVKTYAMALLKGEYRAVGQAQHAAPLVRPAAAHAPRPGRRPRTGGAVLQHAPRELGERVNQRKPHGQAEQERSRMPVSWTKVRAYNRVRSAGCGIRTSALRGHLIPAGVQRVPARPLHARGGSCNAAPGSVGCGPVRVAQRGVRR